MPDDPALPLTDRCHVALAAMRADLDTRYARRGPARALLAAIIGFLETLVAMIEAFQAGTLGAVARAPQARVVTGAGSCASARAEADMGGDAGAPRATCARRSSAVAGGEPASEKRDELRGPLRPPRFKFLAVETRAQVRSFPLDHAYRFDIDFKNADLARSYTCDYMVAD